MSTLLPMILDRLAEIVLIGMMAAVGFAARYFAAHTKNKMVADALTALTALAGDLGGSVATTALNGLAAGAKPDAVLVAKVQADLIAHLRAMGGQALSVLVQHGGVSQSALDAALQALASGATAELQAMVPSAAATPVAVPAQEGVSGK